MTREQKLETALTKLLTMYLDGANSGDWGSWNPEEEAEVIEARKALAEQPSVVNLTEVVDNLKRMTEWLGQIVEATGIDAETTNIKARIKGGPELVAVNLAESIASARAVIAAHIAKQGVLYEL